MFTLLKNFLHIFFPTTCPVCGRIGETACEQCLALLGENSHPVCFDCGLSFPCSVHKNSFWIYNFARHGGKARELVLSLKYGGNEALGRAMGAAIGKNISLNELGIDALVPLPLHKKSPRKFNQARAIAEGAAKVSGLKIFDALSWTRHVEGQTGKNKLEREALPKDIFSADKKLSGKKIIIVDDVCTTGTTLLRAVEACAAAGAEIEGLLVWAKA